MKAAVVHKAGDVPRYEDFPDPVPGDDEVLLEVKAVAVENVDRAIVAGAHFASGEFLAHLPAIPCFDGIGALPDGTLVGFGGVKPPYGALAEKVVVAKSGMAPIANTLDPVESVAVTSAFTGMAVKTAAGFVPGETVLIQGATGVAGRLAVQVARLLGAGRIIATGRDDEALRESLTLGAHAVINTTMPDDELREAYAQTKGDGYDVVIDYLWGRPTEILLQALVPKNFAFTKPTRVVQIGQSAGPRISLSAESLRTSGVEIYGAVKGLNPETMGQVYGQIAEWATKGDLVLAVERVALHDIEAAWQRTDLRGRRLVVMP